MTKDKIYVSISRTKNNCYWFRCNVDTKTFDYSKPVPAENVGDAIEDIAYYIENDLGDECYFIFE